MPEWNHTLLDVGLNRVFHSRTQPHVMKNLVDSLTASLAPRPWDQDGPAAALSALSAASILPAGGMATMRVCKNA